MREGGSKVGRGASDLRIEASREDAAGGVEEHEEGGVVVEATRQQPGEGEEVRVRVKVRVKVTVEVRVKVRVKVRARGRVSCQARAQP